MNKFLILMLAICLVSVHAYVKRDAPATAPAQNEFVQNIQKQFEEISANIQNNLKPEEIQKRFNDFIEIFKSVDTKDKAAA